MQIAFVIMGVVIVIVGVAWTLMARQKNDAWKQFATELGAEFVDGGMLRGSKVLIKVKEYAVTLDTYTLPSGDSNTTYTRLRASLPDKKDLQFTLQRRNWVAKLDKALGTKEINIGDPEFDRDFVIRGENPAAVQAVFSNRRIYQLLQAQKSLVLGVRGNELRLDEYGVIKDVERLKSMFALFSLMLDQLEG
jgi:hypothetical protein